MASYAPSYGSCATSIFNGNTEPRYEELRADRKAISEQISTMVNSRKPFAGRSVADMMEAPIEEFDAAQEVDISALIMGTQIADFLRHLRGFRKYIFFCKTLCKKVFLSAENNANQAHSNCVKWC